MTADEARALRAKVEGLQTFLSPGGLRLVSQNQVLALIDDLLIEGSNE